MQDYLGIITKAELNALRVAGYSGRIHPVSMLAFSRQEIEQRRLTAINTETAARDIMEKDPEWLTALHPRLIDTDDFTNSSSALGELRAYGALLETWMTVAPKPRISGSERSPEFQIDNGDGEVIVEVHSRQLDTKQIDQMGTSAAELRARHAESVEAAEEIGNPQTVATFQEVEVFPTGEPRPEKAGDSVLTNTISRIAAIKEDEGQVDPGKPFILWLDLQDPMVWGGGIAEDLFSPVYSQGVDGYVGSGPFWFALYGRKGDPLLESRGFDYRSTPLAHDGRFFQIMRKGHGGPTLVSAVVYSLPHAIVAMEHPSPAKPLPMRVRIELLKLPRFRLDLSILEWKPGLVSAYIEHQRQAFDSASEALQAFDPGGS